MIKPEAFRLLSGEELLRNYRRHPDSPNHLFCSECGSHPFERGYLEQIGGAYVTVNVACLDGVDPRELVSAPVKYLTGLNNNWMNPPAFTGHL